MIPFKAMLKTGAKIVTDHLPEILSGLALIGLGGSVGSAIHDTTKAQDAIVNAKLEKAEAIERAAQDEKALDIYRGEDGTLQLSKIHLTPWEGFKILAPVYWKTALFLGLTGTCIVGANRAGARKYVALLAAYGLKEKELDEYKDKVKELFGGKKAEAVEHELNADRIMAMPADERDVVLTPFGHTLCYEPWSRTYFRTSVEAVKDAINDFREYLRRNGDASVTDLCDKLELPLPDPYIENHLMWHYDPLDPNHDLLQIGIDYVGHPVTNEPCMILTYSRKPTWS